jgi:hypothetical protein
VIVADPAATPVTTPELETLAAVVSLLDHVSVCVVASEGETVAVKASVPPTVTLALDLLRLTPVTATDEELVLLVLLELLEPVSFEQPIADINATAIAMHMYFLQSIYERSLF